MLQRCDSDCLPDSSLQEHMTAAAWLVPKKPYRNVMPPDQVGGAMRCILYDGVHDLVRVLTQSR